MSLFRRKPIQPAQDTNPLAYDLLEDGQSINPMNRTVEITQTGRLKHIVVRVLKRQPGWHRQLGQLAAVRLVVPYNWNEGYALSVRAPRPRGMR